MSLKDRLKNSKSQFSKQVEALQQETVKKTDYKDDRFWKPKLVDMAGKFTLRFIPFDDGTENQVFYKKVVKHTAKFSIDGKKRFIGQNCPKTLDKKAACPICEKRRELYEENSSFGKMASSKLKPQDRYITNVYIVEDSKNPDNEGKVFLFEFGKGLFENLKARFCPDDKDIEEIYPWDVYSPVDFKLIYEKNGSGENAFPNLDKSTFTNKNFFKNKSDDELVEIVGQAYSLEEFVAPEQFKSYEELEKVVDIVFNQKSTKPAKKQSKQQDEDFVNEEEEDFSDNLEEIHSNHSDDDLDDIDSLLASI